MSDQITEYWNKIRQTASEQLEALAPAGEPLDREGIADYIRENWDITEEEALRGKDQYIADILKAIEEERS